MQNQRLTWGEFSEMADKLTNSIRESGNKFAGIIGISRGGLPLAVILSHALKIPIKHIYLASSYDQESALGELTISSLPDRFDTNQNYLIVDDICDSGTTLTEIHHQLPLSLTATLFYRPTASFEPDFWVRRPVSWVVFPWERE